VISPAPEYGKQFDAAEHFFFFLKILPSTSFLVSIAVLNHNSFAHILITILLRKK
jgi:hypothetical protein